MAETAAHFAAQDVDLSACNPIEMADDLETLAAALGYDQVNLLGHSFGTILGQVWIRRHPQRIARFVSVGTPVDVQHPELAHRGVLVVVHRFFAVFAESRNAFAVGYPFSPGFFGRFPCFFRLLML